MEEKKTKGGKNDCDRNWTEEDEQLRGSQTKREKQSLWDAYRVVMEISVCCESFLSSIDSSF